MTSASSCDSAWNWSKASLTLVIIAEIAIGGAASSAKVVFAGAPLEVGDDRGSVDDPLEVGHLVAHEREATVRGVADPVEILFD